MPGLINEIRSDESVHSLYTNVRHTLCNVMYLYSKNNTYPTVNTAVCSSTFSYPIRVHPTISSTSCDLTHIVVTLTLDYRTFCILKTKWKIMFMFMLSCYNRAYGNSWWNALFYLKLLQLLSSTIKSALLRPLNYLSAEHY